MAHDDGGPPPYGGLGAQDRQTPNKFGPPTQPVLSAVLPRRAWESPMKTADVARANALHGSDIIPCEARDYRIIADFRKSAMMLFRQLRDSHRPSRLS